MGGLGLGGRVSREQPSSPVGTHRAEEEHVRRHRAVKEHVKTHLGNNKPGHLKLSGNKRSRGHPRTSLVTRGQGQNS